MLLTVSLLSLLIWLYLLLGRSGFWRADQRLDPASPPTLETWPAVTAIIPARNEAAVIAESVASVLRQNYPGPLRVMVVDDSSDDGTGGIARASLSESDDPLRGGEVVTAPPLPPGWAGKLWAIHSATQQLEADYGAEAADYIWLTDADIVHDPGILTRLVETARAERLDMVSLMVRLRLESFWERRLVPAFVFFFQKLYPFPAVNARGRKEAAAAGGCILLQRSALTRIGGIPALKDALIDDCTLARLVKGSGGAIWLGLTNESRSLRPYPDLAEFWAMVTRSAYDQLDRSPVMLVVTLISMTLTYLVPPLVALTWPLHEGFWAGLAALSASVLMLLAYRPTLRFYGFSMWQALWLPFAALLYTVMTFDSARQDWLGRGSAWKGRHYGGAQGNGTAEGGATAPQFE